MQDLAAPPRMNLLMEVMRDPWVDEWPSDMQALERALLRQGVRNRDSTHERCGRCRRCASVRLTTRMRPRSSPPRAPA